MKSFDEIDFFSSPEIIPDPNPFYHHLRSKCPVFREQYHGAVMVTGYAEAMEVLANKNGDFSSAVTVHGPIPPLPFKPEGDDIRAQLDAHRPEIPWYSLFVIHNGPEHLAIRSILTSLLTHTRLKKNEEYLRSLADKLLDKILARGRCEFASEYAHGLSTLVIADLLGVPEEEREELLKLVGPDPTQIGDPGFKANPDPLAHLTKFFSKYMIARRGTEGSDMMSELANARFKDGSEPDISVPINMAKFLFVAGQDTSARLMAFTLRILGDNPALQQRLRAERERIPDFIEETLRFEPPVKILSRVAAVKTAVAGVPIPAGTIVTVGLGAATRDPAQFEKPDEFNMDRDNVRDQLAFSRGVHACPGSPLARAEARITLEHLFDRTSDIRISEKDHGPLGARHYEYEPTYMLRGIKELHLEFTPK